MQVALDTALPLQPSCSTVHPLALPVQLQRGHSCARQRAPGAQRARAAAASAGSMDAPKRVLSIQSHVVHGYVGNRCAVFPLQLLGYEVDFINSVQFSNHTGYPLTRGGIMDGQQLRELVDGLRANGLLEYTHLVTGGALNPSHALAALCALRPVPCNVKSVLHDARFASLMRRLHRQRVAAAGGRQPAEGAAAAQSGPHLQ